MSESTDQLRSSMKMKTPAYTHKIGHILYTCPTMKDIGEQITKQPKCVDFMRIGEISYANFEDGFPNLFIKDVDSIRGRECIYLADFLNPMDIFQQLAVIYALPRYYIKGLTLILPYFPTGTMERVDAEGQIATAVTLARILSQIPITPSGPVRLVLYDIHALQERFYFGDNVIPVLKSAVPLFIEKLAEAHKDEKISIAFPDEGAWKRFHTLFSNYPVVICHKIRDGNNRIITVKEGFEECKDHHVFIVDDLVKTGGTLLECKKALLKVGATKVSGFVTHAVFPQESWKRFTNEDQSTRFTKFYVTDSCPTVAKVIADKEPFEVISIAKSLFQSIRKFK